MSTVVSFPQASLSLMQVLEELAKDFKELEKNSQSFCDEIANRMMQTWENAPQIIEDYKLIIQNMPKELKDRPFVKKALLDIESVENDLRAFFEEKREDYSFGNFSEKIDQLNAQIDELENHQLTRKFLRGERVLSSKTRIQWARKIGHMSVGPFFIFLFYYSGLSKEVIWTFTGAFLVWAFSLEVIRHVNPKVNDWVCKVFRPVMREAEKNRINSSIFFITASLLVYLTCPTEVTILTILFLSFGDAIAGIIGVKWGKTKIKDHVSAEGVLACIGTCFLTSYIMVGWAFETTLSGFSLIVFSLMGGFIGAFAETLLKKIDDNLIMPLVCAPMLWVLMKLFSII